jgi:3-oxoacyl-[acyl-carrier protein] reductase
MGEGPILGRLGKVEEAAYMAISLCLPGARFTTGQTIHVSGGMYMP